MEMSDLREMRRKTKLVQGKLLLSHNLPRNIYRFPTAYRVKQYNYPAHLTSNNVNVP